MPYPADGNLASGCEQAGQIEPLFQKGPTSVNDKDLAKRVLGDPSKYPSALGSYLQRYISGNKLIQMSEAQLPDAEKVHLFGDPGNAVYLNSWANIGGGARTGGYYRDPVGRVSVMGTVGGGVAGSVIATLPTGYRPEMKEQFVVVTNTGLGEVDVDEDGNVIHESGGTAFVSLAGISFRAF